MKAPDPLASLYNAPHRRRANRVSALSEAGERPQTIYTPQPIVDVCLYLWGKIRLDPCSGSDSIVPAEVRYRLESGQDGLALPWMDKTYCNSPYDKLKDWMLKAQAENVESVQLVPVRTHRKWWRACVRTADGIAWLNPVTFLGYKCAFPAPLALVYRGQDPGLFKYIVRQLGLGE